MIYRAECHGADCMSREGVQDFFADVNMKKLDEDVVQYQPHHRHFRCDLGPSEQNPAYITHISDLRVSAFR
jgi:hypothetical protein